MLPFISNEDPKKLNDQPLSFDSDVSVSIDPIIIVSNLGRFFNSNNPPHPEKLYRPILIDFNSSQFNMANDWESLFLRAFQLSFCWVNDLHPIANDFKWFNPSILKILTFEKQSSPIINSSNKVKREKLNIVYSVLLTEWSGMVIDVIVVSNDSISKRENGIRLARRGETSIHSFMFIQIRVIDLDLTRWNESGRSTVCRFGISIHDSIIQYQTRKSY